MQDSIDLKSMFKDVLNDEFIKKIIKDNKLSNQQIEDSLIILSTIYEEKGKKLNYYTHLRVNDDGSTSQVLSPSTSLVSQKLFTKNESVPELSLIDHDVKADDFYFSGENGKIFKELLSTISKNKGFLLTGESDSSKTYFFKTLAINLIAKNKTVAFLKLSSFIEISHAKFSDAARIRDELKQVDYLLFDDVAYENMSEWFLNSIFIPLINFRIDNNKVTCFNSLLDFEKWEYCFGQSNRKSTYAMLTNSIFQKLKKLAPVQKRVKKSSFRST